MAFNYFSCNGEVRPAAEAVVPLSSIEYAYGFGVYETIRVSGGEPRFLDEHAERLLGSARIIGLAHPYAAEDVARYVRELIATNEADACNIKILLIGAAQDAADATLYIQCLNPLFPDKKLYRDGCICTSARFERAFPHAKTLNMLRSYLAYREAKAAGAYDALLVDSGGNVTEGTRTNFFCLKGKTLYSPPSEKILLGVTRAHVLAVAAHEGFILEERDIPYSDISLYECAFLTSTSTKIMPVASVDGTALPPATSALRELMAAYEKAVE